MIKIPEKFKKIAVLSLIFVITFTAVFGVFGTKTVEALGGQPSLAAQQGTAGTSAQPANGAQAEGCAFWQKITNPVGCAIYALVPDLVDNVLGHIAYWLLSLLSFILGLAGLLLNTVVNYTIIDAASNVGKLGGINTAWTALRDLANMLFIFILLYIGIGTILNLSSVQTKKMLVHVIIVALLLNFSLFFTKVIIDVSNTVTTGFYNSLSAPYTKSTGSLGGGVGSSGAISYPMAGISGKVMDVLNLQSLFSIASPENQKAVAGKGPGYIVLVGVIGSIIIIITTFIFFAVAMLFIVRYVVLIFLMILSPLAYVAYIVPHWNDKAKKWWDTLIAQSIFPPAFMALLWAALTVLGSITTVKPDYQNLFTSSGIPPQTGIDIIMQFGIAIALLVGTIIISKEIGVAGADTVNKWGKNIRTTAQGFVGRNTLGRAGYRADKYLENTWVGNTKPGRTLRDWSTKALKNEKFGSSASRSDAHKLEQEIVTKQKQIDDVKTMRAGVQRDLTPEEKTKMAPEDVNRYTEGRNLEEQKIAKIWNEFSRKDLDDLKTADVLANVRFMNPDQLKYILEESKDFDAQEKDAVREARFKPVEEALAKLQTHYSKTDVERKALSNDPKTGESYGQGIEDSKDVIRRLSSKEIELGGAKLLNNQTFVDRLGQGQVDNIMRPENSSFTANQKQKLKEMRIAKFESMVKSRDAKGVENKFKDMTDKAQAGIKMEILTDPIVMSVMTQTTLRKMGQLMKDEDAQKLRASIMRMVEQNPPEMQALPTDKQHRLLELGAWLEGEGKSRFG